MRKRVLLVAFAGVFLVLTGCEYLSMEVGDGKLKVGNQSNDSLTVLVNLHYPDTSIGNTIPYRVFPKDTTGLGLVNKKWVSVLDTSKKVTVFVAEHAEGEKGKPKVLKKYILSKAELDSLNWIVSYP